MTVVPRHERLDLVPLVDELGRAHVVPVVVYVKVNVLGRKNSASDWRATKEWVNSEGYGRVEKTRGNGLKHRGV